MSQLIVVSEIQVLPVKPKDGLVAFASCVINGHFYLGNIGIHTRPDGSDYRLVFPVKILPNGKQIQCFHPVTRQAGESLQRAVIQKFRELMKLANGSENVATTSKQSGDTNGYTEKTKLDR